MIYFFAQKHGNAGLVIPADSYEEAIDILSTLVKDVDAWRFDSEEENDE